MADTLPGLAHPATPVTKLEAAAARQLSEMRAAGKLDDTHLILEQLILDLCRVVARAADNGKAAAAGMAARVLMDALNELPEAGASEMDAIITRLQEVS